jgi:hypothetical protein
MSGLDGMNRLDHPAVVRASSLGNRGVTFARKSAFFVMPLAAYAGAPFGRTGAIRHAPPSGVDSASL